MAKRRGITIDKAVLSRRPRCACGGNGWGKNGGVRRIGHNFVGRETAHAARASASSACIEHGATYAQPRTRIPSYRQHDDQAQVRTILRELNLEQAMPVTLGSALIAGCCIRCSVRSRFGFAAVCDFPSGFFVV